MALAKICKGTADPDIDEYFKLIMFEVSVGSCMAPKKDGIAIVGNVSGTNDGVVVTASVCVDVVVCVGSMFKPWSSGHVYVGACFEATGTGLTLVAEKSTEKTGKIMDDPDATESNEVPVV